MINKQYEGNWTEDFPHENGNYMNVCRECGNEFLGHKRRVVCKLCFSKPTTMNTEQVLDIIKRVQGSIPTPLPDFTQALTIAIECMEATQSLTDYLTEQAKTTESRELADIFTAIIRGLTRPQSDTEMYLDSCDKCYAMTNHRDGICLKCEHLTNPNTPIR